MLTQIGDTEFLRNVPDQKPQKNTSASGNVFERLPAREGQTSALFNNSKNITS